MTRSKIAGIGMYVPPNVVTNNDLTKYMETSDAWIQERYYFPGCGVLVQRALKMKEVGALDVRNQCRQYSR